MSDFDIIEKGYPNGEGQASIPDILNDDVIFSGAVPSSAHHSPVYATVEPEGEYMDGNAFMELDSQEDADDEEVPVYCICRKPEGGFMICCEVCNEWYHGRCVGIEREMGERLPQYTCHVCNNATIKQNLELLTAALISSRKTSRGSKMDVRGSLADDNQMEIDDAKKPRAVGGAKLVASVPTSKKSRKEGVPESGSTTKKKRSHEEIESDSNVAKKPKTREPSSPHSTVMSSASKVKTSTITSTYTTSRTKPLKPMLDKHRQSFRKLMFELLHTMLSTEEYKLALKEEEQKASNTALKGAADVNESFLQTLAEEIEQAWYLKCGRQSEDSLYTEQLRTLRFSLKNNPALVVRLIMKTLTPTALAQMTTEDMAPESAKAMLQELRAEDEVLRNKAAEKTERQIKQEKELFYMRGKTDDRILPSLPTFVIQTSETDFDAEKIAKAFISESAPSAGEGEDPSRSTASTAASASSGDSTTTNFASTLAHTNGGAGSGPSKGTHTEETLTEPSLTDSSLLLQPSLPILSAKKVDLDLDAFEVPHILTSARTDEEEPTSSSAASQLQQPLTSSQPKKSSLNRDSDTQTGLRSILNEIAMETGGSVQVEEEPAPSGLTPGDSYTSSQKGSLHTSPAKALAPSVSGHQRYEPVGFTIAEADDPTPSKHPNSAISLTSGVWKGKLTYSGVCEDVSVTLTGVTGARVDRILQRIGLESIDISRVVETDKIISYLPQLDTSSSRVKALLYFEPSRDDPAASMNFNVLFSHLHSTTSTGVVAIKGPISGEGVIREVYVLPVKAGDESHPNIFPAASASPTLNRLYLSLVCDKKQFEKLNSEKNPIIASSSSSVAPSSQKNALPSATTPKNPHVAMTAPAALGGGHPYGGALGGPLGGLMGATAPYPAPRQLGGHTMPMAHPSAPVMLGGGGVALDPRLQPSNYPSASFFGQHLGNQPSTSTPPPSSVGLPSAPSHQMMRYPQTHHVPQQHHQHQYQPHQHQQPHHQSHHQHQQQSRHQQQPGPRGAQDPRGAPSYPTHPPHQMPPSHQYGASQPAMGIPPPHSTPPQNQQASHAAANFLDSLMGVDLANLLPPSQKNS